MYIAPLSPVSENTRRSADPEQKTPLERAPRAIGCDRKPRSNQPPRLPSADFRRVAVGVEPGVAPLLHAREESFI